MQTSSWYREEAYKVPDTCPRVFYPLSNLPIQLAKQRAIAAKVELHQQVLHKAVPSLNLQTL